ncbi:MAG: glycosyltransferase family 39 protein [Chloroflexi bacterium]|nr:glycosyltransferase family 39 protein [Chloroflexota bacterium]
MRPMFRVSRSYAAQAADGEWLSLKNRVWVLIALAVAFFVRVNGLGAQSLWNDEGTSVALAQTSLNAILNAAARDIHPPLYYWLLHNWVPFAGISEFALRFFSVIAGVLVVALTFRIAREFFDQDVAVIAAVLSALNPFQTYYAQETRMYIWLTLFACVSVWAMVRWLKPGLVESNVMRQTSGDRPQRVIASGATQSHGANFRSNSWGISTQTWIAPGIFVLATLAALYTNYYAFTLVLFENLAFVVWLILVWRRGAPPFATLAVWLGANLLIVLAYVPWLAFARASLTAWPGISEPMALWDMTWRILSAFVTGSDVLVSWQALVVLTYILFFVGGLLPSRDLFQQSAWGIVLCALWTAVPLLAMYVVSLARPAYNPKFLLLATPGLLIVVGRGVSVLYPGLFLRERAPYASLSDSATKRLARSVMGLMKLTIGALFAAGTVLALQNMYTAPQLQRDDYRGIVNYINALATARDAVIVDAPGQMDVVRYYYRGDADLRTLPVGRPVHAEQTRAAIVDVITKHDKLFAIYWATEQADPQQLVERSLSEVSFKASDDWRGNVRLAQYAVDLLGQNFAARIPFGDEIFLRRFSLPDKAYAGGDIIPLELVWVATNPPRTNYKVFVHLLDAQGRIAAQHDGEPQNGFSPTSRWQIGDEVSDKIGIWLPVGLPPGEYNIVVGLYRGDTGERLKLKDGTDALTLGALTLGKRIASPAQLLLDETLNARFDALRALGYNLSQNHSPVREFKRGEFIPLVLYWQAVAKPARDLKVSAQLLDQGGNVVASTRAFENYPTSRWDENEIVRDMLHLNIPPNALPGEYKIIVSDGTSSFDVTRVQVR